MGPKENDNLSQSAKPNGVVEMVFLENLKNTDVHQNI